MGLLATGSDYARGQLGACWRDMQNANGISEVALEIGYPQRVLPMRA